MLADINGPHLDFLGGSPTAFHTALGISLERRLANYVVFICSTLVIVAAAHDEAAVL